FGTLNAAERGEAAFQQARDHVERERKAGRIDEKAANRLNNTIGERERTLANGAIRRTAQVEIARQRQQIIDEAVEVARGSVGGGLSMLDEEYTLTYEHGSGEVFTDELDRDRDIIPAVRDRRFAEIDRREDLSVAEKDARKVELLSRNVTMKWPEMERAFTGIALRFRPGATPAEGDDDFAVRAIEFWERMAPYPEIRSSHASG